MDNNYFDDVAKAMARGASRRDLLKLLGLGLLTAAGFRAEGSLASAGIAPARTSTKHTPGAKQGVCRHKGHQRTCNGACCANHGTCETKGHSHGVSCAHGQCCSTGESCCESRDELGHISETCCKAHETCGTTTISDGVYTGTCRRAKPRK